VTVVGCGMVGGVGVCHQSVTGVEGAGAVDLRQPARDWGSHSPNHGVEDGDCCGGGRVNKGPACCIGKPYWGVTKKMCDVDQYGAPTMDGSKEDSQAKVAPETHIGVPQRRRAASTRAPPMDGSKDGQVGAPAAVVLAPAATKGGPTGGWGRAAAVVPAAATALMARSREAAAA
jgi:hypothetical protein